jgi:hypothetical protein
MRIATRGGLLLSLAAALAVFAGGCGSGGGGKQAGTDKKDKDGEKTAHSGWWCDEHGIPEDECIMCSTKLKAEAKAKGDWCKHNRAKSQCFACDPKLKETYAARYRAKYPGKEPPPATDNE